MPSILMDLPAHAVTAVDLAQIHDLMPGYDVRVTQDQAEIMSLAGGVEIVAGWPPGELLFPRPTCAGTSSGARARIG